MNKNRNGIDYWLLAITITLVIIGLIMVYSASTVWAQDKFDDRFYFLKRQLFFAALGFVMMFFMSRIHVAFWRRYSKIGIGICFLLLLLVLIPGVGLERGGAKSWLGVGAFSIQPSEFMKMALILYLSDFLTKRQRKLDGFFKGFLFSLLIVLIAFGVIMLQPDLGTGTVILLTSFLMVYIAGGKIRHFIIVGFAGLMGFALLIISAPYRIARILSFIDPWKDPLGAGFQIIQSLYAIGPAGIFGFGLGQSRQKYNYLPEPQTDFIFAIISEELGFIGACFVLLLFCLLLWRGIRIALLATDLFSTLLSFGIIIMIAVQVMINIAVVIGLMPVTGITLPFLSYGGSSLTLILTSIGILLSISRNRRIG